MAIEDAAQYLCTHRPDFFRFTATQWVSQICGQSETCDIGDLRFTPEEFRRAVNLARGGQSTSEGLQRSVQSFCAHPPETFTPGQKKFLMGIIIILGLSLLLGT